MKRTLLLLALLVGVVGSGSIGCSSLIFQDTGPAVARTTTAFFVQVALTEAKANPKDVREAAGYLNDAVVLLQDGKAPANALDRVAAILNEKIPWEGVRQAVQMGIVALRDHVTIPTSGTITPEVAVWVKAVLYGAIDGCSAYVMATPVAGPAPRFGSSTISFRD